jgi:hypothetical protein
MEMIAAPEVSPGIIRVVRTFVRGDAHLNNWRKYKKAPDSSLMEKFRGVFFF